MSMHWLSTDCWRRFGCRRKRALTRTIVTMNNRLEKLLPVQDVRLAGDVDQKGLREVGTSTPRRDAISHVTGRTVYFEDGSFPGMLHLKMVRIPHHHPPILGINFSYAE